MSRRAPTCVYAECDALATTRRGQMAMCADHAAEHDEFDDADPAARAILDDAETSARVLLELDGPAPVRAAPADPVCPRCLAAQYLPVIRSIVDLPPSPDTNHAAHAAGFGIGALRLIAERPHAPCARHRGGG